MGKTPGKWIKTLLLGKKSPKSAKRGESVVSVTNDLSNLLVDPSQPVLAASTTHQNNGDESNEDKELELEKAAIKVQFAFRAHKARREFRTLEGIVKLQAFIRGHLVRRQAVATYSCIWGIVKFQALVRGQKARSSHNDIQFKKPNTETDVSKALVLKNPTKFLIVDKLLASSPTPLPLKIQYGPEEPNSVHVWLQRWTHFQVWSAKIETIPKSQTKKRNYQEVVEAEKSKPKRGIKKPSGANSGSGSSDKLKRYVRKSSSLPLRTESDKAKHIPRKTKSVPSKDEKTGSSVKRSSLSNSSEKVKTKSSEKKKKKDIVDTVQIESTDAVPSEPADAVPSEPADAVPSVPADAVPSELDEKSSVMDKREEDEPKIDVISDKGEDATKISNAEETKTAERRALVPTNIDNEDDVFTQSGRKVPSYMAPTASAKARLKGDDDGVSPRLSQGKTDKNGVLRRHSLPSPANGTTTMSPRAHKLLIASTKGSINSNKALTSSKDVHDKSTRTQWKR